MAKLFRTRSRSELPCFTTILNYDNKLAFNSTTVFIWTHLDYIKSFLSRSYRLATTVAAVLPTALAAFSTVRSRSSKSNTDDDCSDESKEQFLKLVDLLLSDMKLFKQMVRKSLNLIQGMELMNAGYHFAINKSTGAVSSSNDTKLVTQHQRNVAFPALRLATYKCTIQLLQSYREALSQLLEASPLADYVDMKDHYIAFVDLECFGIEDASTLQDGSAVRIPPEIFARLLRKS